MRSTALMNGALIGFGLGFILASLALYRLVADYVPQYANTWYFQGIAIIERVKARNKPEETE
jgi:heme/copper-type cytochrome/quinol oxidase subunit 4